MANFLGPYYVRINYHGALAPHTMTIPTKAWNAGGTFGTFDTWAGGTVPAEDMIEDLITNMLPLCNADVVFDSALVYKQLLPTDIPQPMMQVGFTGLDGTSTGGGWAGAVEVMFIARTAGFGIAKLDLLDFDSNDDFNPVLVVAGAHLALFNQWTHDDNGWSGRDNTQVTTFMKITKNLNQKLRKEYRLD